MKTRTNLKTWPAVLVLMLAMNGGIATGVTIYVDTDATGANNGSTWFNAFNYLQDALAVATSGDEIRVAEGIYKPDSGGGITPGDQYATFQLVDGIAVYGGFGGETILSGDIGTTNSYHVVTANGCGDGTILDGFVITGGDTTTLFNVHGGGMYVVDSSLTIRNCTFSENMASQGGGMYNKNSSPDIADCRFISNTVLRNGGGMHNNNSTPRVTDCTFSNNQAQHNGGAISGNLAIDITNCKFIGNSAIEGGGGGLAVDQCSPTLVNCTFKYNTAHYGGGMHSSSSDFPPYITSTPTLINCVFIRNSADMDAGAMNNNESDATVTNCTFYGNSAPRVGGMLNINCYPTVTNCILWGNTDVWHNSGEGGQIDGNLGWMTINYSCIQHWSGLLGGVGNIGDDPMFVGGGDCHLSAGSPCIDTGDDLAPGLSGLDIDGNPRIVGLTVDMGAYEFQELLQHAAAKTTRLVDDVEALGLPTGIENSLVSKLENAISSIQKGQTKAAVNKLGAFINEVEAQRGKKIPQGEADGLIDAAQEIILVIESM
jgi:predicted outer membrane repeat protein